MTFNPSSVSQQLSLDDMLRRAELAGIHHWPVVDDAHRLVGIVSDVDIVRAMEQHCLVPSSTISQSNTSVACRVEDFMSRDLMTIQQDESPKRALRTLIDNRIHSLPVLDGERLIAILTTTDYLREFSYGQLERSREPVAACVSEVAEQIDADAMLDQAVELFKDADCNYICVVEGGFPLGILSPRDLRRAHRREMSKLFFDIGSEQPQSLAHLVSQAPTCMPGQSMYEAARKIVETGSQAIAVVTRTHRLIGMITDEDILRGVLYDGL